MANLLAESNGHAPTPAPAQPSEQDTLRDLEQQLTTGYKPSLPIDGMFGQDGLPITAWRRDIEFMLRHPVVRQALGYFNGGVAGAEFWGGPNPDDPEDEKGLPVCQQDDKIGRYIKEQCERFWDRGVPGLQRANEYGWIGAEQMYDTSGEVLKWDGLKTFSPSDTYLLTQDFKPVGVRIKNVASAPKPVDLWMAGVNVPAKGLWYANQPRYDAFYGQSQLTGAWRPWRRAAWKDGAESVLDTACYRFGIGWVIGRYPNEDMQGPNPGAPNTTPDSQGNPRRFGRDIIRQIVEQAKAGAGIGLPSTKDAQGNYKWDIQWPVTTMVGLENLVAYLDHLYDQITQGIGVPPELLEASETGSGYSGRRIPLEAFLANQQQIADALLRLFINQVLKPMVRYNFGEVKWTVQVKSLIKTRTKAAQSANPQSSAAGPQPGQPNPMQQPPRPQPSPAQPTQGQAQGQPMFSQDNRIITDRLREAARKLRVA